MFKFTLQGHSETQGHTSRSLEKSRSHFKVTRNLNSTFQGHISRLAPKVSSQGRLVPKVAAQERPRTYKPYLLRLIDILKIIEF
ncbi:unnamed protein product [Acanthoscelides obtectus]|uniref:Uncharacterized protein n=1 Tax=Acanthoscelides obtectus TaxID=200917 RepID=A0A9P0L4U8_ACAOB|nr:unnamed protein product [Acanthoscelides obtectus]CAK1620344.1 hypothetical protein AOBTE_LOCUS327 [Acanthoscelides obtectus]